MPRCVCTESLLLQAVIDPNWGCLLLSPASAAVTRVLRIPLMQRASCSLFIFLLPRRLPVHARRPPWSPLLHPHLPQSQNPHRLPHPQRASSRPISAPRADAALRPQPAAAPPAGGQGVSAECQIAQWVQVWRARRRRRRLGRPPSRQGREAEAGLRRRRWAQGRQAAQAPAAESHQRLAAGGPALPEEGLLSGRWWATHEAGRPETSLLYWGAGWGRLRMYNVIFTNDKICMFVCFLIVQ